MGEEIPRVPGLPLIGNLRDIDPEVPIDSLCKLADIYGPIYKYSVLGAENTVVSSVELVTELCDEKRFQKNIGPSLEQVRNGIHDGLFTAYPGEHNWETAHRVLVPAFGPLNIQAMFDDMKDIASQLIMKWARHGSEYKIHVTDDFTRLTLDTLALCSMDYRFNSFYQDAMHPFVDAMVGFLAESGQRARRPRLLSAFYNREEQKYWKDITYLRNLSRDLVQNRKDHPQAKKDLLNAMINGKDPRTGEHLPEESIIDNMITFLIAGHETTSGMLSFVFYYLLKNPAAIQKAQEEIDRVVGDGPVKAEHLNKIPYITAILRESLRLTPTAPAFSVAAKSDEVIGGRYHVKKGENLMIALPQVQKDPAVYGDDANAWKPERMLDEAFNSRPSAAWKPFGNGARGCIGRPFAWQEALLVTAMLIKYFDFSFDDPAYTLQIKSTLTIKPKDFFMHAKLRNGVTATQLERTLNSELSGGSQDRRSSTSDIDASRSPDAGKPMVVLYGSNTGTCQAFAQRLAADAPAHGFKATVDYLDSAKGNLPLNEPVVIITASYEGAPCDNGAQFQNWLENLKGDGEIKTSFAVFGAGHSDWKATFHKVPTAIDDILAKQQGSIRICERGGADASKGDMFSEFETWSDHVLWPAMTKQYGISDSAKSAQTAQGITVEVSNTRTSQLRADVFEARVKSAKSLTAPGEAEKRHIEIQLPSDVTHNAGDYCAILPLNPEESVQRVMRHYNLAWDSILTINASAGTILPTKVPISAHDLFGAYVELSQPATKRNITMLIEAAKTSAVKDRLTSLATEQYTAEISEKRLSLLDILTTHPDDIALPLSHFIAALPPMRTRSYSISSSSLWNPHTITLTYSVLTQPHISGLPRPYLGVASHYLSQLSAGDTLHVSIRPSHAAFHLPADSERTPVIMVAAGTGLAPYRGFVQERAAQVGAGRTLAPALLIVGCRAPDVDELYREEFNRWEAMGAVQIVRAYSRVPEKSGGAKYAQDAMYKHKEKVVEMFENGARVYVCGSRALEVGVSACLKKLYIERVKEKIGKDISEEKAEEWLVGIRNVRFATDVFT